MANYIKVYLVRHGQTKWNAEEKPAPKNAKLSEAGKKQAEKMAEFFKDIPITSIYSSPTDRTLQTSKSVLKYHKLKIIECPAFIDRNHGALIGLTHKQMQELIPDLEAQWEHDGVDWRPPGNGETMRETFQRVIKEFSRIIKNHNPRDTILIVTHASAIKCLLHKFCNEKINTIFDRPKPNNCEITEVLWNNGPKRIKCVLK